MICIAICDDESQELNHVKGLLARYMHENEKYEIKIYSFSSPLEMLVHILEIGGFDLILLDIYMPEMLGTDVARKLRESRDKSEIIFLTTSKDHALDAFKVDALQYLVKPYSKEELFLTLDKALSKIYKRTEEYVILQTRTMTTKIRVNEIVYSESYKHNQNIKTIDGKIITVRMTVDELFNKLCEYGDFIKNGSSYILNLKHIMEITSKNIITDIGDVISVPRGNYSIIKEIYMDYLFSGGFK